MRIAIDARPINNRRRHGIVNYVEKLIYGLSEIDNDNNYFLLFTSLKRKSCSLPGPVKKNIAKKVIPLPDRRFMCKDFFLSKWFIPLFLSKYKCDIFHSTFDSFPLKPTKAFYILTVHDLKSLAIKQDPWKQNLRRYKSALNKADVIIAVSETTKNAIIEFFSLPSEKIKVIYEGVDELYRKIEEKEILNSVSERYGIKKKFFFSLGQVPRKNIERLIKAFSLFKYKNDFDLVIGGVGFTTSRYVQYLKLANELNLNGSVKFIGYIEHNQDLVCLYNSAECFVFPSLYEGFGLPILEAMASATPVVTSNVSSLPEIGGDAALYVNPYDEGEIAEAMQRVVEDQNLRNNLVIKGFSRAKEFSWKKTAEETLGLYKEYL